jgi:mRNA-degrading endonuclease RelE of RelBE toxin-antitoxin system
MTSEPLWDLQGAKPALKSVGRAPQPERERLLRALEEMRQNPFTGGVRRLTDQLAAFRSRVGDWRIFFDVDVSARWAAVTAIVRRTTTTYRR